jgi:hypothetical protein
MSGVVSVGWRFACQTSGRINNACSSVGVCLRAARCWWLRICLFYALPQFGHTMLASLPVAQHSLTEAVRSYGKLYKFISASCVQPINSDPMPRNSQCLVLGVGRAGGRTDRRAGASILVQLRAGRYVHVHVDRRDGHLLHQCLFVLVPCCILVRHLAATAFARQYVGDIDRRLPFARVVPCTFTGMRIVVDRLILTQVHVPTHPSIMQSVVSQSPSCNTINECF